MTRPMPAAAMAIAASILLFSALGRADLFNPDEPREAEIAREMWTTGDFMVPRLNGEEFLEKPPLFYWLVVAAYHAIGGPGELAARVLPALAGFLTVVLTWAFGRRLVGERGALLGALVLLTSLQFLWTARRCMIDPPLMLLVLVACGALHRGLLTPGRARVAWLSTGYLATGAAILLKGAVGAGIPALALGGFVVARRDWAGLRRSGLIAGTLAALLPVAIWTAMLEVRLGPSGVREFAWVNNVLRFTGGAAKGHVEPFWYYLPTFFTDFAPWSLAVPFTVVSAWLGLRRSSATDEERGATVLLLSWVLLPLAVLSFASTKRGIYLLPIYPAAALLVGGWLAQAAPGPRAGEGADSGGTGRRGAAWASRIAMGLLLAATIAIAAILPAALRLIRPQDRLASFLALAALVPIALAGYALMRSGRADRLAFLTAGTVGVIHLAVALAIVPTVVNHYVSPRAAAQEVRRMADAGDRVALFRFKEGSLGGYLFYARTTFPHLKTPEGLGRHLLSGSGAEGAPRALALMRRDVYDGVAPALQIETTIVRRFDPGPRARDGDAIVLVAAGNPPAAGAAPAGTDEVSHHHEHPHG